MRTMNALELDSLRPGLRIVERDLGDFRVRGAVLTHGDRAVVFDTLAHPADMAPVARLLEGRVVEVVYSHADWDHCWGTAGLGPVSAVVAQREAARRFREDLPRELADRRRDDRDYEDVLLVPPDVTFQRRIDLFLDGVLVELHALPGHTADSIVAFVPEWGVLLAGDAVETPLPVVNQRGLVEGWAQHLEIWAADPRVTLVVPSHGRIGGRELLEETRCYLSGLVAGCPEVRGRAEGEPFYRDAHARNLALMGG